MIHKKLTVSPLAVARTNEKWWYGLTRWPFVAERLNNFFSSGISSWNTEALRVVVSSSPRLLTELTLWMLFLHVIFCLEKKNKKTLLWILYTNIQPHLPFHWPLKIVRLNRLQLIALHFRHSCCVQSFAELQFVDWLCVIFMMLTPVSFTVWRVWL